MAINMWQWYPSAIKCMSVDEWILGVYWKYVGFLSRLIENCLVDGHAIVRNDRWLWNLLLVGNRNAWLYMTISMKTCLNWKRWKREQECRCAGARPVDFEAFFEPFELAGSTLVRRWFDTGSTCSTCSTLVRHVRPGLPKPLPKSRQVVCFVFCSFHVVHVVLCWVAEFAVCSSVPGDQISPAFFDKKIKKIRRSQVSYGSFDIAMTLQYIAFVTSCDILCLRNVTNVTRNVTTMWP